MYKIPQEVINSFTSLGYEPDEIKKVENIDLGTFCTDENTGEDVVTYALYTDADGSDDIIEFTVEVNEFWIQENGQTIARGECNYDIDVDREEPIGEVVTVD